MKISYYFLNALKISVFGNSGRNYHFPSFETFHCVIASFVERTRLCVKAYWWHETVCWPAFVKRGNGESPNLAWLFRFLVNEYLSSNNSKSDRYEVGYHKWQIGKQQWAASSHITTDLRWLRKVKDQGHEYLRSNNSKTVTDTRLITIKHSQKATYGCRIATWPMTCDDLERLKVKVTNIWAHISRKPWEIRGWLQLRTDRKPTMGCPSAT